MYDELIKDPDLYFHKLVACGWLDEWCEQDIEIVKKSLNETFNISPKHLVYSLSEYTIETWGVESASDYSGLINKLFEAFQIEISSDEISISQDGENISVEITVPDGIAEFEFEQDELWMNGDLLDFINEDVLPAYGEKKILYLLPPESTCLDLVFQYPEVIDSAYDCGLIPDDEYFME